MSGAPSPDTGPGVPLATLPPSSVPASTATQDTTTVPGSTVPPTVTVAFADPVGDLTPSPTDPPPPYADLAGGRLARTGDRIELRVRLGGTVPATAPDGDHTMNVASFYDVDGDGQVDFEVWANLADTGWGARLVRRPGKGQGPVR